MYTYRISFWLLVGLSQQSNENADHKTSSCSERGNRHFLSANHDLFSQVTEDPLRKHGREYTNEECGVPKEKLEYSHLLDGAFVLVPLARLRNRQREQHGDGQGNDEECLTRGRFLRPVTSPTLEAETLIFGGFLFVHRGD